jgi:hypothetical protein
MSILSVRREQLRKIKKELIISRAKRQVKLETLAHSLLVLIVTMLFGTNIGLLLLSYGVLFFNQLYQFQEAINIYIYLKLQQKK